jgi:hypothetical protein
MFSSTPSGKAATASAANSPEILSLAMARQSSSTAGKSHCWSASENDENASESGRTLGREKGWGGIDVRG